VAQSRSKAPYYLRGLLPYFYRLSCALALYPKPICLSSGKVKGCRSDSDFRDGSARRRSYQVRNLSIFAISPHVAGDPSSRFVCLQADPCVLQEPKRLPTFALLCEVSPNKGYMMPGRADRGVRLPALAGPGALLFILPSHAAGFARLFERNQESDAATRASAIEPRD
jgi:hypothetical protein